MTSRKVTKSISSGSGQPPPGGKRSTARGLRRHYGLQVNDLVRVGDAPQVYLLEWIGERGFCVIRAAGAPLAGGLESDLSKLKKVDRT